MDFIARKININPPKIPRYFGFENLNKFPEKKPIIAIKNDAIPMIEHEISKDVSVKLRLTPDTRASILVAIPSIIAFFVEIHSGFSFGVKASNINFSPRIKNIAKTIHSANGSI